MLPNGPLRHLASRLGLSFIEKTISKKVPPFNEPCRAKHTRFGFHPDDTTPIPRPYKAHLRFVILAAFYR